ncbi:MAG TPA: hypothetical protein VM051_01055, partial [Usitatibacter sp.]|nr:hypothetical protein [Usitatibacter sp.]
DAQGILHPGFDCRDWSVPGPFYSAGTPKFSWHEMHHAAFHMSDEYCPATVHSQHRITPNVYDSKELCEKLGSTPSTCKRIALPLDCVDPKCECSTSYWRSDSGPDDVMMPNKTLEQADDLRAIDRKFDECKAGLC